MSAAVFAGVSAANAAAASAAAARARAAECRAIEATFDARTATVEQKQSYASCVETLYPQHLSGAGVLLVKIAIVLAFAGAAIGAWKPLMGSWSPDISDRIMGALIGALIGPSCIGVLFLAWAGVEFLFQ